MTTLIRPQAKEALMRWREPLGAAALASLGLYWALTAIGPLKWLGWVVIALGLTLLWAAFQRFRFASQGEGPGVVQIIEGEIQFFGPGGGGFAAVDAMVAVSLGAGGDHWLIESAGGEILVIPRAAAGGERLFDVFASLPGLDMAALLRQIAQAPVPRAQTLWRRTLPPLLS